MEGPLNDEEQNRICAVNSSVHSGIRVLVLCAVNPAGADLFAVVHERVAALAAPP